MRRYLLPAALQSRVTKLLDDSGVPMLAGSDACGAVWEIPGCEVHQEFDLLAEAGLAPLRILQMTTLNGAERFLVELRCSCGYSSGLTTRAD